MPEDLVGISEASKLLGVSEQALRQWTDEGRIKAFVTPGGHRRFSRVELKKFLSMQRKTLGIKDLAIGLEETVPAHREMDASYLTKTAWSSKLDSYAQKGLALRGRNFLNLVIRLVTEPSRTDEIMVQVREAGRDFGDTLAQMGVPLTDSVQIFIQHRDPIVGAVIALMQKRGALSPRVAETNPLINRAMDEALVALVTAHQMHRNSIDSKEGINPQSQRGVTP